MYDWTFENGETVRGEDFEIAVPDGYVPYEGEEPMNITDEPRLFVFVPEGYQDEMSYDEIPVMILHGVKHADISFRDLWPVHPKAREGLIASYSVKKMELISKMMDPTPTMMTTSWDDIGAYIMVQDTGYGTYSYTVSVYTEGATQMLRIQTGVISDIDKETLEKSILRWLTTMKYDEPNYACPTEPKIDSEKCYKELINKGNTKLFEEAVDEAEINIKMSVNFFFSMVSYQGQAGYFEDHSLSDYVENILESGLEVKEYFMVKIDALIDRLIEANVDKKVLKKMFIKLRELDEDTTKITVDDKNIAIDTLPRIVEIRKKWKAIEYDGAPTQKEFRMPTYNNKNGYNIGHLIIPIPDDFVSVSDKDDDIDEDIKELMEKYHLIECTGDWEGGLENYTDAPIGINVSKSEETGADDDSWVVPSFKLGIMQTTREKFHDRDVEFCNTSGTHIVGFVNANECEKGTEPYWISYAIVILHGKYQNIINLYFNYKKTDYLDYEKAVREFCYNIVFNDGDNGDNGDKIISDSSYKSKQTKEKEVTTKKTKPKKEEKTKSDNKKSTSEKQKEKFEHEALQTGIDSDVLVGLQNESKKIKDIFSKMSLSIKSQSYSRLQKKEKIIARIIEAINGFDISYEYQDDSDCFLLTCLTKDILVNGKKDGALKVELSEKIDIPKEYPAKLSKRLERITVDNIYKQLLKDAKPYIEKGDILVSKKLEKAKAKQAKLENEKAEMEEIESRLSIDALEEIKKESKNALIIFSDIADAIQSSNYFNLKKSESVITRVINVVSDFDVIYKYQVDSNSFSLAYQTKNVFVLGKIDGFLKMEFSEIITDPREFPNQLSKYLKKYTEDIIYRQLLEDAKIYLDEGEKIVSVSVYKSKPKERVKTKNNIKTISDSRKKKRRKLLVKPSYSNQKVRVGSLSIPVPNDFTYIASENMMSKEPELSGYSFVAVSNTYAPKFKNFDEAAISISISEPYEWENDPSKFGDENYKKKYLESESIVNKYTYVLSQEDVLIGFGKMLDEYKRDVDYSVNYYIVILCGSKRYDGYFYFNVTATTASDLTDVVKRFCNRLKIDEDHDKDKTDISKEQLGEFISDNGKLNAVLSTELYSKGVVFNMERDISYTEKCNHMKLCQLNALMICDYPKIFENETSFKYMFLDMVSFVDGNTKLNVPKTKCNGNILKLNGNNLITGTSLFVFMNLNMLTFSELAQDKYVVRIDENLINGIPGFYTLIGEFVKSLRAYNENDKDFEVICCPIENEDSPCEMIIKPVNNADAIERKIIRYRKASDTQEENLIVDTDNNVSDFSEVDYFSGNIKSFSRITILNYLAKLCGPKGFELTDNIREQRSNVFFFDQVLNAELTISNNAIKNTLNTDITRPDDSRIKQIEENTEEIISRNADKLRKIIVRFDEIGRQSLEEGIPEEKVIEIYNLISETYRKMHIEASVSIDCYEKEFKHSVDREYTNILEDWENIYKELPSYRLQIINSELNNKNDDLNVVNKTIADIKSDITDVKNELEEKTNEYEMLKAKVDSYMSSIFQIDSDIQVVDSDIKDLMSEILCNNKTKAIKESEYGIWIESNDDQYMEKQRQIDKLYRENLYLKVDEKLKREECEKTHLFKKGKERELEVISATLSKNNREMEYYEKELISIKRKLIISNPEITELISRIEALENKVRNLQQAKIDKENQKEALQTKQNKECNPNKLKRNKEEIQNLQQKLNNAEDILDKNENQRRLILEEINNYKKQQDDILLMSKIIIMHKPELQ